MYKETVKEVGKALKKYLIGTIKPLNKIYFFIDQLVRFQVFSYSLVFTQEKSSQIYAVIPQQVGHQPEVSWFKIQSHQESQQFESINTPKKISYHLYTYRQKWNQFHFGKQYNNDSLLAKISQLKYPIESILENGQIKYYEKWKKGLSFYKIQLQNNVYISSLDIQTILTQQNMNIQLLQQLKHKNAYKYISKYFQEHLLDKLYQHQGQIGDYYDCILINLKKYYQQFIAFDRFLYPIKSKYTFSNLKKHINSQIISKQQKLKTSQSQQSNSICETVKQIIQQKIQLIKENFNEQMLKSSLSQLIIQIYQIMQGNQNINDMLQYLISKCLQLSKKSNNKKYKVKKIKLDNKKINKLQKILQLNSISYQKEKEKLLKLLNQKQIEIQKLKIMKQQIVNLKQQPTINKQKNICQLISPRFSLRKTNSTAVISKYYQSQKNTPKKSCLDLKGLSNSNRFKKKQNEQFSKSNKKNVNNSMEYLIVNSSQSNLLKNIGPNKENKKQPFSKAQTSKKKEIQCTIKSTEIKCQKQNPLQNISNKDINFKQRWK